jgi:RNA polymerase sigma-70 factor (ECF subfamily)
MDPEEVEGRNMQSMARAQPASQVTDELLADAARAGDNAAFAVLVERYRNTAFACAYAHLRGRDEAEDVVQEAFVRAYVGLGGMQSTRCWAAWLMRIVRNLCTDSLRRHRSRPSEPLDDAWPDDAPTPEMSLLTMERGVEIRKAIDDLPEKLRVPLIMHYVSRRTLREVALALDVPETTVVGRLSMALQRLRRRLQCER